MVEFIRDFQKYVTEHPELKDIGPYVQESMEEQLRTIFPSRDVLGEIKFGAPERELADVLVLHKDAWLFIECKGRQPQLNKPPSDPVEIGDWIEKRLDDAKVQIDRQRQILEQGSGFYIQHQGLVRPVDFSKCPKALFIVALYGISELGIARKTDYLRGKYGERDIQMVDALELPSLTSYLDADEFVRYFAQREKLFSSGKVILSSFDRNLLQYFLMNKDGFQSLIDAEDPFLHSQANDITLQLQGFNFYEYYTSLQEEVVSRNKEFFRQFRGERS